MEPKLFRSKKGMLSLVFTISEDDLKLLETVMVEKAKDQHTIVSKISTDIGNYMLRRAIFGEGTKEKLDSWTKQIFCELIKRRDWAKRFDYDKFIADSQKVMDKIKNIKFTGLIGDCNGN